MKQHFQLQLRRISLRGVTALAYALATPAFAAASDTEFKSLYDLVHTWSTGYLGTTISIAFLVIGLAIGVVRGSIMGAVACIAAAAALSLGPDIISSIFNVSAS